jgi:hypothetical protein
MEVHDTHSHEPVFLFSTIPVKEARCLEAARESLFSIGGRPYHALLPCGQPPACFCWQRVSLRHQRGRTTSSGTDFLTQLSGCMVDLTKVYWRYTTFRRRTAWIPEVCSVDLTKAYPETDKHPSHPRAALCYSRRHSLLRQKHGQGYVAEDSSGHKTLPLTLVYLFDFFLHYFL